MQKLITVLALFFGVASNLHVSTGVGYVGMFDLVSYVLGPVLYVRSFGRFSKKEQTGLLLIVLWVFGSFLNNFSVYGMGTVTLKATGITASMWCMSVVWLVMLRAAPHAFIYIILGMYIGNVVGLYVFQNGALLGFAEQAGYSAGYMGEFLQEKQVLPNWLWLVCVGGGTILYLLIRRSAGFLVGTVFWVTAFIGLFNGGSRLTFGINMLVALLAYGMAGFKQLARFVLNNLVVFVILFAIVVRLLFMGYSYLAQTGQLGEGELEKYEQQFSEDTGVADSLSERGGYEQTWNDFKTKPFGHGGVGAIRHSAISDSVYKEGLFAIPFWSYFMWVLIRFLRRHLYRFDRWAPFLGLVFISVIWNALASPFGGRGTYCFAGCFAILSETPGFLERWAWYEGGKRSERRAGRAVIYRRYC
jgi:hypothetical protein